MTTDKIIVELNALHKPHSTWERGVWQYVESLIEVLKQYEQRYGSLPNTTSHLQELMLDRTTDWKHYSYAPQPASLYSNEIAERLYPPSMLKRLKYRPPSGFTSWHAVQAVALKQAAHIILDAAAAAGCRIDIEGYLIPVHAVLFGAFGEDDSTVCGRRAFGLKFEKIGVNWNFKPDPEMVEEFVSFACACHKCTDFLKSEVNNTKL